jgi:hypothetical protein
VGAKGREIFFLVTCPLQLAEVGSVVTLSQKEKKSSVGVQQGGFISRGDVLSASSSCWPIASRRTRHRRRMFERQLRHLRLRKKNSARVSGGPSGGKQFDDLGHKLLQAQSQ